MACAIDAQVHRRRVKRRVVRKSATASAAALIGDLDPGDEISGITNGQFSLIDITEHVLNQCGPSDVCVATWTMGIYDVERAVAFVRNGLIKSIQFIVDPSIFTRKPELSALLVQGFGVGSFRPVASHAKFLTVRGRDLAVCVRSSMNLNPNNRVESFDLSVCDELTAFYEAVVAEIWEKVDAGNRSQSKEIFADLLGQKTIRRNVIENPWFRPD